MEVRLVPRPTSRRGRPPADERPSADPASRERRRRAIENWAERDPLIVPRPRRRPLIDLPAEPLNSKDGLPMSFCGAFRLLVANAALPLNSLARATGAAVWSWYDYPAKSPTVRQKEMVGLVEGLLAAPPGSLTRRLRSRPVTSGPRRR